MEFRSLLQHEEEGRPSVTRIEAHVFSVGLHLLLLLLVLYLPGALPPAVAAFFRAAPRPLTPPQESATPATPVPRPAQPLQIPLTYASVDLSVRVPNDHAVKENPNAPILSNRNRQARQEMPTPSDAQRLSIDPHSEGDTIHRVKPDPDRPEGPEVAEPTDGERPGTPTEEAGLAEAKAREAASRGAGTAAGSGAPAGHATGGEGTKGPPPGAGTGGPGGGQPGQADLDPGALEELAQKAGDRLRESLRDVQSGEFKFTFHNPAYLRSGSYGTMSFDTKDYPWGDYDRLIYVRIGNSWRERLPLAFREGIRGYACLYFTIERDGTVSRIVTVKPSRIPPFTRAAEDAIRAGSPLPPLPNGFPNDREGVTFCFYYNMFPGEPE